jgi:hypothetical protein
MFSLSLLEEEGHKEGLGSEAQADLYAVQLFRHFDIGIVNPVNTMETKC